MKNIKISEVFGLPVHVHKKDRSYTLFDQNIFKNGMVGLVLDISQCDAKEELAINAIATAINAYDTNQARIAELEGTLKNIAQLRFLPMDDAVSWLIDNTDDINKLLEQGK